MGEDCDWNDSGHPAGSIEKLRLAFVSAWGLQNPNQNTPEMNLAKQMVARGLEVDCLTYAQSGSEEVNEVAHQGGLTITRLPRFARRVRGTILLTPGRQNLTKVTQAFLRRSPDVWHMHHPSSLSISASFLFFARRTSPVVFTSHDPLVASGMRPIVTRRSALSALAHSRVERIPEVAVRSIPYLVSDKIIALTNFERRVLLSQGIEARKVVVIPHGVRPTMRSTGLRKKLGLEDKLIVLTVARFVSQKGHRYLIEAIPSIVRSFDAHFLMIGRETGTLAHLRELAKSLNVSGRITFLTSVRDRDLDAAYTEADVFVLPSLYESFGIVLLEAMAAGKPVVATDVGGVRETVEDRRTGIVVPPADSEALSRAIQTLLRSPEQRSKLGREGEERVAEKYSWRSIADRTEAVYDDALKA